MYYLKYNENIKMSIKYLRIAVNLDCAKKILSILLINQKACYNEAFNLLSSIKDIVSMLFINHKLQINNVY